jgi:nucleoid DNA-binding protein
MDTLRLGMMQGESVEIGGFGTFLVMTDLKGERIPTFSGGRTLRRVINTLNTMEDEY